MHVRFKFILRIVKIDKFRVNLSIPVLFKHVFQIYKVLIIKEKVLFSLSLGRCNLKSCLVFSQSISVFLNQCVAL